MAWNGQWCHTVQSETSCQEDSAAPVVRINEMLVKGIARDMKHGKRLSSDENDITFKYSSISLTNPGGISYQVMLEGYAR